MRSFPTRKPSASVRKTASSGCCWRMWASPAMDGYPIHDTSRTPSIGPGRVRLLPQALRVDDEAVADVGLQHALVGLVHLLGGDDLDVGGDAVLPAEVEHLLGLGESADEGT